MTAYTDTRSFIYDGNGYGGTLPVVRPPHFKLDTYASNALEECEKYYRNNFSDAEETILTDGLSAIVAQLSDRLNATGLEDSLRLLLSRPPIYAALIRQAVKELGEVDQVKASKDIEGLQRTVLRLGIDQPKRFFWARMVADVLNQKRIRITSSNRQWERLDDLILSRGIPIRVGQVESAIDSIIKILRQEGNLPYYIGLYAERSSVDAHAFKSPAFQQAMIDTLQKMGIKIASDAEFQAGRYDEYFALAYHEALKLSTVKDDPIDQMRTKGKVSWDFTIDAFDDADVVQGVIPDNIRAAGALDYVYTVGELMRVFDTGNALVLRWAGGVLDIPEGKTASDLYRFHKLRNERSTYEERAMLYKRVLNKGDGKLLSNMVANTGFPRLWHKLMVEVTEYIRKSEGKQIGDAYVSRAQLYQATKNLQYNLTETMTGMAHIQVTEDYAHLQEAMTILKADEILNMFGGRRKTIWSVIEQVAKEDLGVMVPTAPLRTLAVEGNKIFQWIAEFNEGIVREGEFREFLSAAEAWIIAQASIDSEEPAEDEDDFGLNGNGQHGEDDDFSDWEV